MRLWLCLVEADADEAERVSPAQADAGEAWLDRGLVEGYLTDWNSYAEEDGRPRTGGYMIAVAEDRAGVWALLEGRGAAERYPLLETIRAQLDIRPVNRRGGEGFGRLRAEVAAAREAVERAQVVRPSGIPLRRVATVATNPPRG